MCLGKAAKQVVLDWEETFETRPVLLEIFVDCERFSGTFETSCWVSAE